MFKRLKAFLRAYPTFFVDPQVPAKAKYLPWVALLYFLAPIDLIPDVLPLLGQMDDIGVIVVLFSIAMRVFEQSPKQKEKKRYGDVIEVEAIKNE